MRVLKSLGAVLIGAAVLAAAPGASEEGRMLPLTLRRQVEAGGRFTPQETKVRWKPAETAVIVIDMWDRHWCAGANRRGAELAPRADRFVARAREAGALIVHAPSGCMEAYRDHPARRRAQSAPPAPNLPEGIEKWCYSIPAEERGKYPLDQTDGGCDCQPKCATSNPWKRQMDAIRIRDEDAISDSGPEVWNLLEQRGIRNVLILGVHTNMCILGRPFGLRNMARFGKNVALVRDLTDTMYNPRAWPYVDHFRGTGLIVEHIEKYVCPTVSSEQLLGGKPFRFREAPTPEPKRGSDAE
ncbi:MAG: hypothetical protein ACK47B_07260 [Armatimonadota bacterium]